MKLSDGYSRAKNPETSEYRPMTLAEGKALTGGHLQFTKDGGTVRKAKINGKPKTWKTDPNRLEVPCKYGMYEYATAVWRNGQLEFPNGAVVVVRVDDI